MEKTLPFADSASSRVSRALRKAASKKFSAFTLVELIVVITILAILATIGFLALSGYTQDAKDTSVKANVRSIYSAIAAESAHTGNSPRFYVVHDTGAALSDGALAFVDGSSVTLSGGAYGTAGTNYSAGNPDWAKLKLNPEKFRISDNGLPGGPLSALVFGFGTAGAAYDAKLVTVGALDVALAQAANGRSRSASFFQVAGVAPETKIASVVGNFPAPTAAQVASSGATAGLVKAPTGTGALIDGGTSGAKENACSISQPACTNTGCTLNVGNPTIVNQTWTKGAIDCGFVCKTNYSGNNCEVYIAPSWTVLGNYGFTDNNARDYAIYENNGKIFVGGDSLNGVKVWSGSTWMNVGVTGYSPGYVVIDSFSMIPDNNGNPITAGVANYALKLLNWSGTGWQLLGSTISVANQFQVTSLAKDSSGNIYLGHSSNNGGDINIYKYNGSTLSLFGSANFANGYLSPDSLITDNVGNIYFIYSTKPDLTLKVLKWNGSNWTSLNLPYTYSQYSSAKFDKNNHLVVVTEGNKKVLVYDGTSWIDKGIFTNNSIYGLSLAVDNSNNYYIGYRDSPGAKTTVIKFNGTNWETVGNASFGNWVNGKPRITVGSDGTVFSVGSDGNYTYKATVHKY